MTSPIVHPSEEDPVVASSLGWMGGGIGRRARIGGTWWSPVRVLVAMSAMIRIVVKKNCCH